MTEGARLVVAFPDPSESFASGFDMGTLWRDMESGVDTIDRCIESGFPIRSDSVECAVRMASVKGYRVAEQRQLADGWTAILLRKGKPRPILSIVTV